MSTSVGWRELTPHEIAGEDKSALVIGPFGSSLKVSDYRTEGVPLIFVRDIRSGDFTKPRHFIDPQKAAELGSHLALPGDVLITKMGDPPGDSCVYNGTRPSVITADCIRLRPASGFDPRYISLILGSLPVRRQMEEITSGVAQRKVSLARFRSGLRIPIPSPDEQCRIVAILEDHLSRLDAGQAGLNASIKRLAILRQATLAAAMREARSSDGCQHVSLGDLADVRTGMTPLKSETAYYNGGTIPWITSGDLHRGIIDSASQFVTERAVAETSLKLIPAGAILIAMYGEGRTRGTAAELAIPATTNQACAAVILRDLSLLPWVRLVLGANYDQMRRIAAGGVQPNLNLSLIRALEIPIPLAYNRSKVLQRVAQLDSAMRMLKDSLVAASARGTNLRRSLLTTAFSGGLTGDCQALSTEELVSP